ncbi:glutamyl-tRNA reductase [Verrucomicrobiaceae bacterium N1E253]|uniref:Glutamyl-tRNA reductase n=1 Tax=Oceaniferula marina TaxID=2748318 RepID=A0A851GRE9_9BACT|nr:glutamyl-tRNA reductase [Oceaniferula marina]NWK57360.1 glutamyl-tRNA reductase [Oceaniferula marina]
MELICIGLNHETAPVEVREHFAVPAESQGERARQLIELDSIGESVVLSTCNRMEVYVVVEDGRQGAESLKHHLACGREEEARQHLYLKEGDDARRHLFRLVCGLDSMVLGETEIFGQVKQAYKQSHEAGATKGTLNKLFQKSFAVGKKVRTHTRIQVGPTSVGSVAVDLAEKIFGALKGCHVMIIGAGETSRKVAMSMLSRGAKDLTVTNRSEQRAIDLAAELNGKSVPFTDWENTLIDADVVVSSTGATEPVLRASQIEAVRKKRKYKPLFLIDIAVPRDIESAAGEIEEVYLYDMDMLQKLAGDARASRQQQVQVCEQMIEQEMQ